MRDGKTTVSRGLSVLADLSAECDMDSQTADLSESLFKQATESDSVGFHGRKVETIAAATLVIASRETGDVRTPDEVAEVLSDNVESNRIHSNLKELSSQLGLGLVIADPEDYVDRIADELNADQSDTKLAKRVIETATQRGIAINRSPRSIAATAFYYVGAVDRATGRYTQAEIANVVDVSTLTVRENHNEFVSSISLSDLAELDN